MDIENNELQAVKEKIQVFIINGHLDESDLLLNQYEEISSNDPDLFSLRAMLCQKKGSLKEAISWLSEGLERYPLRFDLHINLASLYEEVEEYLETYHLLMRASYLANQEQEMHLVGQLLERIKPHFKGSTQLQEDEYTKQKRIQTSLQYGNKSLTIKSDLDQLLHKHKILHHMTNHLSKSAQSILEIEFGAGIISRNLTFYGYHVEAIDSRRQSLLEVISKDWHENLRNPKQNKAKFFHNQLSINQIDELNVYDVIISDLDHFGSDFTQETISTIIEKLLQKVNQQLFLIVSKEKVQEALINFKQSFNIQEIDFSGEHLAKKKTLVLLETKADINMETFSIPDALETKHSQSTVVEIEIEKCSDKYGFTYTQDGYHPFVNLLREYQEVGNLSYENSSLQRYYASFQPKHLAETLDLVTASPNFRKGWIGYPWLWNENLRVIVERNHGETRPGGNHFFGPNTYEFGKEEMERLITTYQLIEKTGYLPELFSDGYVSGYLLKNKHDYRFIVTEGQHRMAVLAALGYKKIRCRFIQSDEYPKVVDIKEIKKWPQVKNGTYSRKAAEQVFQQFFILNGSERKIDK